MSELEGMISNIMSNPEEMKKIMEIASSIMGGSAKDDGEAPDTKAQSSAPSLSNLLSGFSGLSGLSGLSSGVVASMAKKLIGGGLLGGGHSGGGVQGGEHGGGGDKKALIQAMKPWLSAERGVKLDRAVKLARVMRIAGSAFLKDGG